MASLEPIETQYPINAKVAGVVPCTVWRNRQIYQNVQLGIRTGDSLFFVWIVFGDNCPDGFDVADSEIDRPDRGETVSRDLARQWLDGWMGVTQ